MVSGRWIYIHSSLCFAASYFAVLEFGGFPPRIKILLLNPSIDKSVRVLRLLEQVFQLKPYDIQRVEGKDSSRDSVSTQKMNAKLTILKCFGGRGVKGI